MRTRVWLTTVIMAAGLLAGGTATAATAQATPASFDTSTTTAVAPVANSWIYVGTYSTHRACYDDGKNSIYSQWECRPVNGKYQLWVNNKS
ncbi:hypothetical protein [Streptomyces sp. 35G-GA-8]|uniref:hypothetical protein n=1 Tax=Streptomyces sp. 35G-GA-8 TaxID=2939434 RepID=UPI00201F0960|nr:hypothetical protein [Streptomyces sp. 35G-GA-8]MCL7380390.1 hypothetical protein [Streptomyces sp. 35G-GA-8]